MIDTVKEKELSILGRQYFVDGNGNIYSSTHRQMSKYTDKDGYEYVLMRKSGKRRKLFVHRIVANAFISNPDCLPQVNHIDGNKANNSVQNLEWVTNAQNQYHSRYVIGNKTGFEDVQVVCVETGEIYKSTRDAWRKTGVNYSHISECANGKRKSAGGYTWKRME